MLNIVSPLSKVPPEILGEIFYQCSLYASDAPLALSAVCSRFRSVALTTPQIWRRLRLVVNSEDELAQATAKAKRWFSLAGTCSLDLYIDLSALTTTTPIQSLSDLGTMPSHLGSSPLVELQKDGFEASGRVGCDCKGVRNLQVLLHSHSGRIQSLALRFVTQLDAQAFLQAIYAKEGSTNAAPAWQAQFNASVTPLPLQKLTLHVVEHAPSTHAGSGPPVQLQLPELPFLTSVKLNNVNIPFLPRTSLRCIRNLTIIRPLRAPPLPTNVVSQLLRSTPCLTYFELNARVLPFASAPNTPNTQGLVNHPLHDVQQQVIDALQEEEDDVDSSSNMGLITLASLTHLTLRANNLPLLLDHLVVPSLCHLHINDLDGKRPNASSETSEALREVLVRMDLPFDQSKLIDPSPSPSSAWPSHSPFSSTLGQVHCDRCISSSCKAALVDRGHGSSVKGTYEPLSLGMGVAGLKVLELENVGLGKRRHHLPYLGSGELSSELPLSALGDSSSPQLTHHHHPHLHGHNLDNHHQPAEECGLWEWCFRRMSLLRTLRCTKMDNEELWRTLAAALEVELNANGLERVVTRRNKFGSVLEVDGGEDEDGEVSYESSLQTVTVSSKSPLTPSSSPNTPISPFPSFSTPWPSTPSPSFAKFKAVYPRVKVEFEAPADIMEVEFEVLPSTLFPPISLATRASPFDVPPQALAQQPTMKKIAAISNATPSMFPRGFGFGFGSAAYNMFSRNTAEKKKEESEAKQKRGCDSLRIVGDLREEEW